MGHDARQAALAAFAAGLSVLPPKEDGSKAPDGKWLDYQRERATSAQIELWYGPEGSKSRRSGCGLVCGDVSGGLECLEFDGHGRCMEPYRSIMVRLGHQDLLDRLDAGYLERSPSGGFHWLYRCSTISGNAKLAVAPDGTSLIETRGNGGYIVVAPSNGKVHQTGGAYELISGGFDTIPTITPAERDILWDVAKMFDNQGAEPEDEWKIKVPSLGNTAPWDVFNANKEWRDILIPHGWTHVFTRDGVQYWRRPGKDHSHSATINHGGTDRLKCFSSSAEFATVPTSYSKFGAWAVLEHGGDWRAAIKAVKAEAKEAKTKPPPLPEGASLVVRLDKISPKEINWLWPNWIPKGFITIVCGTTGGGKTFTMLDIVARLTRGDVWPDSRDPGECADLSRSGNALIISEDPFEYVLSPRLIELGANLDRVYAMTWEAMQTYAIDDTETLGKAFAQSGNPSLIVIDPPTNFLGEIDEHKNSEVRAALMQLVIWLDAQTVPVACVLITHVNKNTSKGIEAVYRVIGSVAWVSTARAALAITKDPEDPSKSVLVCAKSNIGKLPTGIGFRIEPTEKLATVKWLGERDLTADEAMGGEAAKQTRGEKASDWLEEKFSAQSEYLADDILKMAKDDGISYNALHEPPANQLPIVKEKKKKAGQGGKVASVWRWIGQRPNNPDENNNPESSRDCEIVEIVSRNPLQDNIQQQLQPNKADGTVEIVAGTVAGDQQQSRTTVSTVSERDGSRDGYKQMEDTGLRTTISTISQSRYSGDERNCSGTVETVVRTVSGGGTVEIVGTDLAIVSGGGTDPTMGVARTIKVLVDVLRYGCRTRDEVVRIVRSKGIADDTLFDAIERLEIVRSFEGNVEMWDLRGKLVP